MDQDKAAGKALMELIELGIVDIKDDEEAFLRLAWVYAIGHDSGRQLRSFSKPVAQLSLKGDVLNIFESVQDAVRATGLNKSNIANCARGRKGCLTAGGFRWQYINTTEPIASETETVKSYRPKSNPPK